MVAWITLIIGLIIGYFIGYLFPLIPNKDSFLGIIKEALNKIINKIDNRRK